MITFLKAKRTWLMRGTALLGVLYLGVCWYVMANQETLIFHPSKAVPMNPAMGGLDYTEVWMPVDGDEGEGKLHGYWVKAGGEGEPRGTVLLLHGNGTTIGTHLIHVTQLHERGCDVLMVDYRNYGNSSEVEELSETSIREDALAAWRYLLDDLGADPRRTFIFGHSLGGAIAIDLAAMIESDDRLEEPAGLIVESTFTCLVDMSSERYMGCLRALPLGWLLKSRFESVEKVPGLGIPKLFIHGTADDNVPHTMAEELHRCAREPKELLLVEGAGHRSCGAIGGDHYRMTVDRFMSECLAGTR